MRITDKIKETARTIRTRFGAMGQSTHLQTTDDIDRMWMEIANTEPNSIAGKFYNEATDKQAKKVFKEVTK